ncbi:MAG: hypothetical protein EOO78_37400, partial [Oxalobacteraceae bacterium]
MDPFESFFGDFFGFSNGNGNENKETPRGADVVVDLWVTYEELYVGQFVELQRVKPVYQPAKGTRKCNCRQEMITRQLGPGMVFLLIGETPASFDGRYFGPTLAQDVVGKATPLWLR